MTMRDLPPHLNLEFNPFEPTGAGPPLGPPIAMPDSLKSCVRDLLDTNGSGAGVKAVFIVGEYGVGKTCLLQWLHHESLPKRRIKPFYFDNPSGQFYSLANALLRALGRKDFAKFIWELAEPYLSPDGESIIRLGYEHYLSSTERSDDERVSNDLRQAILKAGVTDDEEIGSCLAKFVTSTKRLLFYDYRDFLPKRDGRLGSEGETAPYLGVILKAIMAGTGAEGIAFLIDEFAEIGLQKRLTRRAVIDYRATLKRLINLTHGDDADLWLFLSMTPDAYATTIELDPALAAQRKIDVGPLSPGDAAAIVKSRIDRARADGTGGPTSPFPFRDVLPFRPAIYSNPRRLVKTCSFAISKADRNTPVPFHDSYLREVERRLYPPDAENGSQR